MYHSWVFDFTKIFLIKVYMKFLQCWNSMETLSYVYTIFFKYVNMTEINQVILPSGGPVLSFRRSYMISASSSWSKTEQIDYLFRSLIWTINK